MTWDSIWMYFCVGAYFVLGLHSIFIYCNFNKPSLLTFQVAKTNPGQYTLVMVIVCYVTGLFFMQYTSKHCTEQIFLLQADSESAFNVSFNPSEKGYKPCRFLSKNQRFPELFEVTPGYDRKTKEFITEDIVELELPIKIKQLILKTMLLESLNEIIIDGSLRIIAEHDLYQKNMHTQQMTSMCRALSVISVWHLIGLICLFLVSVSIRIAVRDRNHIVLFLLPDDIFRFVSSRYYWLRFLSRLVIISIIGLLMCYIFPTVANDAMEQFMLQLLQAGALPTQV